MDQTNYVEVQEEVVTPDTMYMCGACYGWFQCIEEFNSHNCPAANEIASTDQTETTIQETCTVIQEEGDLEKDVANILGEMKYTIPSRTGQTFVVGNEMPQNLMPDQTYIVNYEVHPSETEGVSNLEEQKVQFEMETVVETSQNVAESVEIPSSCLLPYENPAYLNRLMKDNTVGKRVRHDAPYTHRLGPWDDVSTKLMIRFVKEVPAAYFIASDNVKRTEAWELIRNKLSEADHHFTVLQIRMRWRELCKKYRNVVNCNEIHDINRTCQFFDELNDLFGIWNREATEILIRELSAKNIRQNGGLRMRFNTWDKIRRVLSNNGFHFTAHQVHGRWNALVTLYQRMVDRNLDPSNEPLDMAYKELIEPMFPYVPPAKKGKAAQAKKQEPKDKWTVHMERVLLQSYTENIENFRKNEAKNSREVWAIIVEKLRMEHGFLSTVEKVRTRFYELAKYYSTMLRYNSQPGTLHRESKHHETLARIYNRYNLWPHDGSIIKLDNSNARRMRQLNAQLRWSEDESRAALQLYPQVLSDHLQSSEQQPLEELWVQMAKMLMQYKSISKLPYEIEEHIVLLRRGFKSDNPFPFRPEMEELEETEHSLCFSPEESPSTDSIQLIPYWSHMAAQTLLSYIFHYRQEGVKTLNDSVYEVISLNLESHGYNYSGKECRQYYLLLRKVFKNKTQSCGEEPKEASGTFPYWSRMMELKSVSHIKYNIDSESHLKILEAASSKLEGIGGGDDAARQLEMERNLTQLKMYLMNGEIILPPPPIKMIAHTLLKFLKNEDDFTTIDTNVYFSKLRAILEMHMDVISKIAERGAMKYLEKLQSEGKKRVISRGDKIKTVAVTWTDETVQSMLITVKEWRHLCHDELELENILCKGQPLWDEVAYNLSRRVKKSPDSCKEYFDLLCYKFVREELIAYKEDPKAEEPKEPPKESPLSVNNRNMIKVILSPLISHDAEWDSRDVWWAADSDGWSCEETLELLFTVRELLSEDNGVDWDQVKLMMFAGGFDRTADRLQSKFIDLYNGYKRAYVFNKNCLVRARRRPPYYFKIHTLFGFKDAIRRCHMGAWNNQAFEEEAEEELVESLMGVFKEKKNLFTHMVPRIPLMNTLASCLVEQYKGQLLTYSPNVIWCLLVKLHNAQAGILNSEELGPFGRDLDGLWQNHANPLVAFGLQAIPTSGWQWVKNWSIEELNILIDNVIHQCLPEVEEEKKSVKIPNIFMYQLGYMLSTFKHGGYEVFDKQLTLIYMLQKWSHLVFEERNSVLHKVKENYKKIEESKAILRSAYNGKSSGKKLIDEEELSNSSEESDEKDLNSDSDGDLEATDTDDETSIELWRERRRKAFSSKPDSSKYVGYVNRNVNSSGLESSLSKKGKDDKSENDFKYVFRVTTTPALKIGVRTMKNPTGNMADSSRKPKITFVKPGQDSGGNEVQIDAKKLEKLDDGSITLHLGDSPTKMLINTSDTISSKKRKNVNDSISPSKMLRRFEAECDRLTDDGGSPSKEGPVKFVVGDTGGKDSFPFVKVQKSNTQVKDGGTVREVLTPQRQLIMSVNGGKRESCHSKPGGLTYDRKVSCVKGGVAVIHNDKQQYNATKRKRKNIHFPSKPNIEEEEEEEDEEEEELEESVHDEFVEGEEEFEEEKETLMELTNQYYSRRKQEKARLITTFNSVQESHHKQASALLAMFDNLQSLL